MRVGVMGTHMVPNFYSLSESCTDRHYTYGPSLIGGRAPENIGKGVLISPTDEPGIFVASKIRDLREDQFLVGPEIFADCGFEAPTQ